MARDRLGARISKNTLGVDLCQICFKLLGAKVYDCPSALGPWAYHCPNCAEHTGNPHIGTVHVNYTKESIQQMADNYRVR